MAAQTICGICGSALASPSATCPRCGAAPAQGGSARHYPRPRKNPALAAALAIVPGMGHVYLGQNMKGGFFLLACGGLEFLGFDFDLSIIGSVIGVPLGLSGIGLYGYQIFDAYRLAKQMESEPV